MCLIFQQSEPSTLINRVLIKKRMCKLRASDARILKQNKNIVSFPLMVSCIRPTQNKANGFSPPQQSQKQKQQPFRQSSLPIPPTIHPPSKRQMNTATKPKFTHDPLLHYLYNNIIVSVAFSPGLIPSFPLSLEPDGERIILGPRREKRGKGRRVEGRGDDSLLF